MKHTHTFKVDILCRDALIDACYSTIGECFTSNDRIIINSTDLQLLKEQDETDFCEDMFMGVKYEIDNNIKDTYIIMGEYTIRVILI